MRSRSGKPSESEEQVGPILAGMRRAKKMTGGQLGKLVGMSQPKISRLENGVGFPDPDDVAAIAQALDASDDQIRHLRELAERSHDRMTDWRPTPRGLAGKQRGVGEWESQARAVRVFQPAVIVGLLQTSEYARAVLSSFQELVAPDSGTSSGIAVSEAVSVRVQRQEILMDPNRTFHFLMAESVLSNRICPPEHMPAQIQRLRELAQHANVTIGFIPTDAWWKIPPYHGFVLIDDDIVIVDLFNTGLTSRGKADSRLYQRVFDTFEQLAVSEIEPILDRYLEQYLDLSRPRAANSRRPVQ